METYQVKSLLIGRKKSYKDNPDVRPCFINLFKKNNPHKSGEVPFKVLEYEKIHKVIIKGLDINYLLPGNDLVINNLLEVSIDVATPHIFITGKQS